jgi:hypothetical protein
MQPVFDELRAMLKKAGFAVPEFVFQSNPAFIEKLLSHIQVKYGGAKGYMEAAGLSGNETDALRNKLV